MVAPDRLVGSAVLQGADVGGNEVVTDIAIQLLASVVQYERRAAFQPQSFLVVDVQGQPRKCGAGVDFALDGVDGKPLAFCDVLQYAEVRNLA